MRNSQIQKIQEACWKNEATTCWPHRRKRYVWLGTQASFYSRNDEETRNDEAATDKEWNQLKTIPARDVKKARPKSVDIRQAKKDGQQLTSRIWYRAVFTGHGASASRMAAAMFLDTISKFLGVIEERKWRNFSVFSSQNGRKNPDCYDCRKINVGIRQELDDQICCVQLSKSLARSWTKWNKACGKRWPKLINCISEAMNCRQFWHEVNQIEDAKLGLFHNASFAGDLRHSEINVTRFDAHSITCVCSFFLCGCARIKPRFLTAAVPCLKLFLQTQVYVWMGYQLFNLEIVSWKHYPMS